MASNLTVSSDIKLPELAQSQRDELKALLDKTLERARAVKVYGSARDSWDLYHRIPGEAYGYLPGMEIKGNPSQRQEILEALDNLHAKSPLADAMIKEISEGYASKGKMLTFVRGPVEVPEDMSQVQYNGFSSNDGIIVHTPKYMYDGSEAWMRSPYEIALAHELVHAWNYINGKEIRASKLDMILSMLGIAPTKEELQTVGLGEYAGRRYSENAIRREYGIVERPRY